MLKIISQLSALYFLFPWEDVMLEQQLISVTRVCENLEHLDPTRVHLSSNAFDNRPFSSHRKTSDQVRKCSHKPSNDFDVHQYRKTGPVSNIERTSHAHPCVWFQVCISMVTDFRYVSGWHCLYTVILKAVKPYSAVVKELTRWVRWNWAELR